MMGSGLPTKELSNHIPLNRGQSQSEVTHRHPKKPPPPLESCELCPRRLCIKISGHTNHKVQSVQKSFVTTCLLYIATSGYQNQCCRSNQGIPTSLSRAFVGELCLEVVYLPKVGDIDARYRTPKSSSTSRTFRTQIFESTRSGTEVSPALIRGPPHRKARRLKGGSPL